MNEFDEEDIADLMDVAQLQEENTKLHSIIKEVREYTNKMMTLAERKGKKGEENGALYVAVADILEILDKDSDNKE